MYYVIYIMIWQLRRRLPFLRPNRYDWRHGELRQTCKHCRRPSGFDYSVPDSLWIRVVPKKYQNRVLCLACFDRFAAMQGIKWLQDMQHLIFVGESEVFDCYVDVAQRLNIEAIRRDIEQNHGVCIEQLLGGMSGDFGEIFCGHIHGLGMTFKDLATHFDITMSDLAELTADHIRTLMI